MKLIYHAPHYGASTDSVVGHLFAFRIDAVFTRVLMKNLKPLLFLGLAMLIAGPPASAGEADVVKVAVRSSSGGVFHFDVTVRHGDEGWQHYADAFEIVSPDGTVLGTRVLLHPHETEQPFTRSLRDVRVPAGITAVIVRARDKVHGQGGKTMLVALPGRQKQSDRKR